MKYSWPLNDSHFSWIDRLKIAAFFLNPRNRWTQGEKVKLYEQAWKDYTKAKYVIMTSSGSTANTLIAEYAADKTDPERNIVVFPAVTWQTSVSPWIRQGFIPKFIDINLDDFAIDYFKLEQFLKENADKVNTVFVTSLIGLTPDIPRLEKICKAYNVTLKFDNCENSFGRWAENLKDESHHICSKFTCSTSNYFGHQTTNGGESGLIFTNSEDEYVYYIMNRSHGMVRTLQSYPEIPSWHYDSLRNSLVDPQFDFAELGNNYRNTDIGAFIGLLDFERIDKYIKRRLELFEIFQDNIDFMKFNLPASLVNPLRLHVPFCIPIITYSDKSLSEKAKDICRRNSIEYRPIISGNLLRQTCYLKYGNPADFPNAEYLHNYGFYVGLYPKLKSKQIYKLVDLLNSL